MLGFQITRDERDQPSAYLALERGAVRDFRLVDPDGYYWRVTTIG